MRTSGMRNREAWNARAEVKVLEQVTGAVWKAYEELGDTMFTGRRIEMLRRIRSGQLKAKYSDVFVDEVQDFSPADIECVLGLHNGQGSAFYVGDEAQALSSDFLQPPKAAARRLASRTPRPA